MNTNEFFLNYWPYILCFLAFPFLRYVLIPFVCWLNDEFWKHVRSQVKDAWVYPCFGYNNTLVKVLEQIIEANQKLRDRVDALEKSKDKGPQP